MAVLTEASKRKVQRVIDTHFKQLKKLPGFVAAEPGFALVDGSYLTKPAIIVLVTQKLPRDHLLEEELAPHELGGYRVDVMQADPVRQLQATGPAAVRNAVAPAASAAATYTYERRDGNPIDKPFTVTEPITCHIGPDAGWPVLKDFLGGAKDKLSVAIYDFNAAWITTELIGLAEAAEVEVSVNWDDSPRDQDEIDTFAKIRMKLRSKFRDVAVPTGSGNDFANSYHEKVAVRDSEAFWLSSGNWTRKSQPDIDPVKTPEDGRGMYGKYNREWHVVVNDTPLAKLFEDYIRYDFDRSQRELKRRGRAAAPAAAFPDVFVPIEGLVAAAAQPPEPVAPQYLPPKGASFEVQPVLTPDNYVTRVTSLLQKSKKSIYMQLAYINFSDEAGDEPFTKLLNVIKRKSNQGDVDVRIIVGANDAANKVRKLVEKDFNQEVFRQQTNIHNKGIIVDGETVLVSSANWSSDGILRNRDAGLIIRDADIAGYYQDVFLDDWEKRASKIREAVPAIVAAAGAPTPSGMARLSWQDYMQT